MEFKLVLEADRPTNGDLVLSPETALSGVKLIEEVGKCLRRSIDTVSRSRHVTLGALVTYEISVPQAMAIESGLYETTDTVTVIVENNLLSNYVFYGATINNGATGRPCYPYLKSEATLVSYIDELAFLQAWADTNYATRLAWSNGKLVGVTYTTGTNCPNGGSGNTGIGCGGCTCGEHPHHCPPPPKPPVIGNPSHVLRPGDIVLDPINSEGGVTA